MISFTPIKFSSALDRFKKANEEAAKAAAAQTQVTASQLATQQAEDRWNQNAEQLTRELTAPFIQSPTYGTITKMDLLEAIRDGIQEASTQKYPNNYFTTEDLKRLINDPGMDSAIETLKSDGYLTTQYVRISGGRARHLDCIHLTAFGTKAHTTLRPQP